MRVEFFVNPSEGLSGVLTPIAFHDCPTSPRGRIQFGGRATLYMHGDRHILDLRCDRMPSIDADALEELVRESTAYGPDFNPRQERGTLVVYIPLKGLRSQWTGGRLLCYAEVGQHQSSSMEISGVRTVLVLCDRQHHFRDYFRRRSPDRAIGGCDYEFGQTRYVYIQGQNWRGLRPEQTRWATLGPCPVANLERLNEAEAIAYRYERIFLEEDEPRTTTQLRGMRVSSMFVDDPIARHDSSEYIEEMARVRYATEIQRLAIMESLGLDVSIPSTPRPENIYSAWLGDSRVRDREAIGNTQCKFNALSRHLRCAVRPVAETCSGCTDFEERV